MSSPLEEFARDTLRWGIRISTNPARKTPTRKEVRKGADEEYQWWNNYVRGADQSMREMAAWALRGSGCWTAEDEKQWGHLGRR